MKVKSSSTNHPKECNCFNCLTPEDEKSGSSLIQVPSHSCLNPSEERFGLRRNRIFLKKKNVKKLKTFCQKLENMPYDPKPISYAIKRFTKKVGITYSEKLLNKQISRKKQKSKVRAAKLRFLKQNFRSILKINKIQDKWNCCKNRFDATDFQAYLNSLELWDSKELRPFVIQPHRVINRILSGDGSDPALDIPGTAKPKSEKVDNRNQSQPVGNRKKKRKRKVCSLYPITFEDKIDDSVSVMSIEVNSHSSSDIIPIFEDVEDILVEMTLSPIEKIQYKPKDSILVEVDDDDVNVGDSTHLEILDVSVNHLDHNVPVDYNTVPEVEAKANDEDTATVFPDHRDIRATQVVNQACQTDVSSETSTSSWVAVACQYSIINHNTTCKTVEKSVDLERCNDSYLKNTLAQHSSFPNKESGSESDIESLIFRTRRNSKRKRYFLMSSEDEDSQSVLGITNSQRLLKPCQVILERLNLNSKSQFKESNASSRQSCRYPKRQLYKRILNMDEDQEGCKPIYKTDVAQQQSSNSDSDVDFCLSTSYCSSNSTESMFLNETDSAEDSIIIVKTVRSNLRFSLKPCQVILERLNIHSQQQLKKANLSFSQFGPTCQRQPVTRIRSKQLVKDLQKLNRRTQLSSSCDSDVDFFPTNNSPNESISSETESLPSPSEDSVAIISDSDRYDGSHLEEEAPPKRTRIKPLIILPSVEEWRNLREKRREEKRKNRERRKVREEYASAHLGHLNFVPVKLNYAIDIVTRKLNWDAFPFGAQLLGHITRKDLELLNKSQESKERRILKKKFILKYFREVFGIKKNDKRFVCCKNRTEFLDCKAFLKLFWNISIH